MLKYLVILAVLIVANADDRFKQCKIETGGRFPTEWPLEPASYENKCFCQCALYQMGYIDENQHFQIEYVATEAAEHTGFTHDDAMRYFEPVDKLKDTPLWSDDPCQNGFLIYACIRTLPFCVPFPN